jgi:group I intron endonuclease
MSIYSSIYRCINILTGESYVGYDSNWPSRKTKHLYDFLNENSKNYNCHFYRALRKYGIENFVWEVLYQSWDKKHCLNEMEPYFIQEHQSFVNGYNMTKGGEGTFGKQSWLGKKHNKETKNKISQSLMGKIRSKEHSKKISDTLKGKPGRKWTDEQKKKQSEKNKGKQPYKMTQKTKEKISNSTSGGKHYSAIPVTIDNVYFSCKKEACEKLKISKHQLNKILSSYL